ncbi:MAG: prepilin-type N-terminal cleavage/methylation domain-containing protein [Oscillospiraceae bacterium]
MKKLLIILKKRRSHGFTLVEMIVAVALLAILLAGMMIFITPILQSYKDNQTLYTAENVATSIQRTITGTLRNAYQVAIFTSADYNSNKTTAIMDKVKPLATYVNSKNADTTISLNRLYELRCLSLRCNDGQYYLCDEVVTTNPTPGNGYIVGNADNSALLDSTKVFSDVLYNGLYMDFGFSIPTETKSDGTTQPSIDTLKYTIKAYGDKNKKSVVFNGAGMTELYAIKVLRRSGGAAAEYNITVNDVSSATGKDIYIYYVARKLKGVSGP